MLFFGRAKSVVVLRMPAVLPMDKTLCCIVGKYNVEQFFYRHGGYSNNRVSSAVIYKQGVSAQYRAAAKNGVAHHSDTLVLLERLKDSIDTARNDDCRVFKV